MNDAFKEQTANTRLARLNFRPLLFFALFLAFGIFLYLKIRFGNFAVADLLFLIFFLFFAIWPLKGKRLLAIGLCFVLGAGLGVLSIHIYTESYLSGPGEGEYTITGVVSSLSEKGEGQSAILSDLTLSGRKAAGKMKITFAEGSVALGDLVCFEGKVTRNGTPSRDYYSNYCYESDIRYNGVCRGELTAGRSSDLFLRLKSRLRNTLLGNMGQAEGELSFALITGDSSNLDGSLSEAIRRGGIAHIFAVSGLHIGIIYAAIVLLCRPLGRYATLSAIGFTVLYSAFCGFSVSSVRAFIMCAVLGLNRLAGRKTDFLSSISLAAILILLFAPAEWLSAGFRLSFGACLGLALFAGPLSRGMKKLRFPAFLREYLAGNLAVQLFTFPIVLECFSCFPVWGLLLNLVLIPVLPPLFIGLLVCTLFALIIPPAAFVFLFLPANLMSYLPFLFSVADLSFVLTGFSLGLGVIVWLAASVALSGRVRLRPLLRGLLAGGLSLLFAACLVLENVVFTGAKITVEDGGKQSGAALIETRSSSVLIVRDLSLTRLENFLNCHHGGQLDAVIVLSEDELGAINSAAFLPAKAIYAFEPVPTGLNKTPVAFAQSFTVGEMEFFYESREKLFVTVEGRAVEFDFFSDLPTGDDLFVQKESGGLKYFLKDGIIKEL